MLNIVIFGAPGSGKGTQSERIVAKYGINHISTGDVLRAEIKAGTELGKTAKGYIDQGQLLPDNLIVDILASTLDGLKDSKGVIFDGFPRTIAQAEALKKMLAERGQEVSIMLDLEVPEDELMNRLILRGQQSGRADPQAPHRLPQPDGSPHRLVQARGQVLPHQRTGRTGTHHGGYLRGD